MDQVQVYENLRGLVYAPFYAGIARDIFKAAGVQLDATLSPSGEETAAGAAAGRVDLAWGGPMRVMAAHDAARNSAKPADLVCFGLAVTRDPFMLIARKADPTFTPAKLIDKKLLVATHAPTPWLLLQDDVRRLGLNPGEIMREDGVEPMSALRRLHSGEVDYVLAFEPWGSMAERGNFGLVISAGANRGHLAFTSFYASRAFTANQPKTVERLIEGLIGSLSYVRSADPQECAETIAPWFPDFDIPLLSTAISRYQRLDIWPGDAKITVDGFVRLKSALISGGFITSDPKFEQLTV